MIRTLTVMIFAMLLGCSPKSDTTAHTIDEKKVQLTAEEQQYVKEHPTVSWAAEENRPPFVYLDNNDQVHGSSLVFLNLISKKTGLKFVPVKVGSFISGINAVRDKQVDLMTAVRPTADRIPYMGFSAPFVYNAGVFVFRQNSMPRSPLRAGIRKGDAGKEYLLSRFADIRVVETEDNEEAISLLEKGLLDVAIMNEASADYLTRKSIIKMRKASTDFDYPYSFGFQKDNVILGSIISKAIVSIRNDEKQIINDAWQKEK